MLQIRDAVRDELGDQEQLDRRRRELNKYFVIEKSRDGKATAYRLVASKAAALDDPEASISEEGPRRGAECREVRDVRGEPRPRTG